MLCHSVAVLWCLSVVVLVLQHCHNTEKSKHTEVSSIVVDCSLWKAFKEEVLTFLEVHRLMELVLTFLELHHLMELGLAFLEKLSW